MQPTPDARSSATIPVVEEQLELHREIEETGAVRVRISSQVREAVVDEPVIHRGVQVERVARDMAVTERRSPWRDGEVLVVPVYEEVVVRQLLLKEEIRLVPTTDVSHDSRRIDLRSETAVVERLDATGAWQPVGGGGVHEHR